MSLAHAQAQVRQFMLAAEQTCPPSPIIPDSDTAVLRHKLIAEELQELCDGINRYFMAGHLYNETEVLSEVADAIADLMYVVLGTAVAFGINITPVWEAVHEANMRKFDGGHRRADGKFIKSADWKPPDLVSILAVQMD